MAGSIRVVVSYSANGGSGAPSSTTTTKAFSTAGTHSVTATLSSTKPTRSGYTFNGWSPSSVTKSYTFSQAQIDSGSVVTFNETVFASWKINSYTISYNSNGGTGTVSSQKKNHGATISLKTSGFSRNLYRLSSWNTSADGSGTTYALGASYSANKNLTLYAIWESVGATVSVEGGILSDNKTISIVPKVDDAVYDLYYTFGNVTTQTKIETTTETTYSWDVSGLGNAIPNVMNDVVTVYCHTIIDGVDYGEYTATATLTVPEYYPTASIELTDTDTTFNVFVQSKSVLNGVITASSEYGAGITSVKTSINGASYTGTTFTTSPITEYGTPPYSITITDTRGVTATITGTYTVYQYFVPTVSVALSRKNGNTAVLSINHNTAPIVDNEKTYTIGYKQKLESTYITLYDGTWTNYSGIDDFEIPAQEDISYDFEITSTDTYGTVTFVGEILTSDDIVMRVDSNTKDVTFLHNAISKRGYNFIDESYISLDEETHILKVLHDIVNKNGNPFLDDNALKYKAGDSVSAIGIYAAYVTSGTQKIYFYVPLAKDPTDVVWSLVSCVGEFRTGVGGYVSNGTTAADNINWLTGANFSSYEIRPREAGLTIILNGKKAWTGGGIVNNMALVAHFNEMQLLAT